MYTYSVRDEDIYEDELVDKLVSQLLFAKTQRECKRALRDILTVKGLRYAARRLEIAGLLRKGIPLRDIALELGAGIATVEAVSKSLQDGKYSWL